MKAITEQQAFEMITQKTKGRVFSAQIVKKDGSERPMNCKLSVKRLINGQGMSWNPRERNMIPVVDTNKDEYRMINLSTLKALQIDKQFYTISHDI